jgi:hypothetical protein
MLPNKSILRHDPNPDPQVRFLSHAVRRGEYEEPGSSLMFDFDIHKASNVIPDRGRTITFNKLTATF